MVIKIDRDVVGASIAAASAAGESKKAARLKPTALAGMAAAERQGMANKAARTRQDKATIVQDRRRSEDKAFQADRDETRFDRTVQRDEAGREFTVGRDEAGREFTTGRDAAGREFTLGRDEAKIQQQKEQHRMLTDTQKLQKNERRSEYESGLKQIQDARGKYPTKSLNDAKERLDKKFEDVSSPWFAEITKEEDKPTWKAPDGTEIPLDPESQKAYELHRKYQSADEKESAQQAKELKAQQKKVQDEADKDQLKKIREIIGGEMVDKEIDPNSGEGVAFKHRREQEMLAGRPAGVLGPSGEVDAISGASVGDSAIASAAPDSPLMEQTFNEIEGVAAQPDTPAAPAVSAAPVTAPRATGTFAKKSQWLLMGNKFGDNEALRGRYAELKRSIAPRHTEDGKKVFDAPASERLAAMKEMKKIIEGMEKENPDIFKSHTKTAAARKKRKNA